MIKTCFCGLMLFGTLGVTAQRTSDTMAIIRDFDDVMDFAVQPYVHFLATIDVRTGPMIPPGDSGSVMHAEFYKLGDDLYYGVEAQEMYLQDSLMVRVDHVHRMIQINRVDVATKKNLDILPLKRRSKERLFRSRYRASRAPDRGDTAEIRFASAAEQKYPGATALAATVVYVQKAHLPVSIEVTTTMWEPQSDKTTAELRSHGFNVQQMKEVDGRVHGLVMFQTTAMRFGKIDLTAQVAGGMPRWTRRLAYDPKSGEFSAVGGCQGYRVFKSY